MELHGMYMLAVLEKDSKRAHMLTDKQKELAKCFEMENIMRFQAALILLFWRKMQTR